MPLWHTAKNGPVKYPVIRTKSDRVDVEVIGPSETMDLETECGSGLCQQLAGDFLFHCHVAHHYIAGMWGYWRVYNTIQQGANHNDVMPDLLELPDRKGRIKVGITSDELIGKTVDWFGKQFTIKAFPAGRTGPSLPSRVLSTSRPAPSPPRTRDRTGGQPTSHLA